MSAHRPLHRLVPAAAVAAVTLAALGATWLGRGDAPSGQRPSLATPAPEVVKAPPEPSMRAVSCRGDCAIVPAAPTGRY